MIHIVIADDHTIMRKGLKRIFEGMDDIRVAGEAVDGSSTFAKAKEGGVEYGFLIFPCLVAMELSKFGRSGWKRQSCPPWF